MRLVGTNEKLVGSTNPNSHKHQYEFTVFQNYNRLSILHSIT